MYRGEIDFSRKKEEKENYTPLSASIFIPEATDNFYRKVVRLDIADTDHLDDSVDLSDIVKRKEDEKDDYKYIQRALTSPEGIEKLKNYLLSKSKEYHRSFNFTDKDLNIEINYFTNKVNINGKEEYKEELPKAA